MAMLRWRPATQAVEHPWDPFRDLSELQTRMGRFVEGLFGRPRNMADRVWAPPVDAYETKDELVVTAAVPGVNEKDISVSITGELLTLRGERLMSEEATQETRYRGERWYGKFERTLSLPIPVEAGKVKASYRD